MLNRLFPLLIFPLLSLVLGGLAWAQSDPTPTPDAALEQAIVQALVEHARIPGMPFYYAEVGREMGADAGVIYLNLFDKTTTAKIPGVVGILVVARENGAWTTTLPGEPGYSASYDALKLEVVQKIDTLPYKETADPIIDATLDLTNYRLPWNAGEFATVSRSYFWHGRGMIDFDLTYTDIAAPKDGVIVYANDSRSTNAYDSGSWWYWNTVIMQHGEHEFSMVGHIRHDTIPQWIKDGCSTDYSIPNCAVPIRAGDIIAQEGSTGYSSNPHVHVEFGQAWGIAAYTDNLDDDHDGDRAELIYAAHVYAEHNVAFVGYTVREVESWAYGTVLQSGE